MSKGSTLGKNPSVEWFWNDWAGGTSIMTRHLKGCYMDLLHAQFNNGHLSLDAIRVVLASDFGQAWPTLQKKFAQDEDGLYYNQRLDFQIKKKGAYNKSRDNNLKGDGDSHMGYGNGLGSDLDSGEKGVQGEKHRYVDMIESGSFTNIRQLKQQLTNQEAVKLELAFGDLIVEEVFNAMDNKVDLIKKYTSVYRTALDWCKRRKENNVRKLNPNEQGNKTGKPFGKGAAASAANGGQFSSINNGTFNYNTPG